MNDDLDETVIRTNPSTGTPPQPPSSLAGSHRAGQVHPELTHKVFGGPRSHHKLHVFQDRQAVASHRMTPPRGHQTPSDSSHPQAIPLCRLGPSSATETHPTPNSPSSSPSFHGGTTRSTPSTVAPDPEQPGYTNGTRLESGDEATATVSESMTQDPTALRSTTGFASPSYGATSSPPQPYRRGDADGNTSDDAETSGATTPTASASGGPATRPSAPRRRRRSVSVARSSAELGSTATVGVEGRFGTTETALLNDLIEGHGLLDSDPDDDDDESLLDYTDAEDEDENDPSDNSPYPQVRASVAPTDNTTLSINTPRMWVLSILFSFFGSSTNLFFSLRYPSVAITPVIALLLAHPLGLLWDFFLKRADDPPEEFLDGFRNHDLCATSAEAENPHIIPWERRGRLDRLRLWLAQGRWNEKEHSCVYVSSNVSFGFAFATDVIVEQTQFYKQEATIVYQLLLTLSTQILGYTFAGLTRRFLVRPSGMIWPGTLMSAAMFTTLHKEENKEANGWRISRWKFFYAVWLTAFLFYFLPGLLFPALSYFNVITWFAPDNVVVANLFGVVSGLGLFPVTFDWAQIAYIGSPLLTPFWAAMNVVGGLVVVMWVIAPIAYYSNWLYSSYMPILSAAVFDNTGNVYDVSKVLTKDFLFDREAYSNYSRVFLPITYVLSYGVQFAGLASLLTHTFCWHGSDIWAQWKRSLEETSDEPKAVYQPVSAESSRTSQPANTGRPPKLNAVRSSMSMDNLMSREDVHNRLMRRYKDAPMLWYLATFISMTAIGIFVVE